MTWGLWELYVPLILDSTSLLPHVMECSFHPRNKSSTTNISWLRIEICSLVAAHAVHESFCETRDNCYSSTTSCYKIVQRPDFLTIPNVRSGMLITRNKRRQSRYRTDFRSFLYAYQLCQTVKWCQDDCQAWTFLPSCPIWL